jgi:hypothetical protein
MVPRLRVLGRLARRAWTPTGKKLIPFGKKGQWDQDATHDPHPVVYKGKIYTHYKAAYNKWPDVRDK